MRTTVRATVRILSLSVAALGGALIVSAAGISPRQAPLDQAASAAQGDFMGEGYAISAGRISASSGADFAFDAPSIGVADKVVVAVSTHRAVKRNPAPASVSGNAVLEEAAKYVGTPYRVGGSTPAGFDCSGFVRYVYGALGVSLPRTSSGYQTIGTRISAADARPGDLIVSSGHVAIYAGGNLQIDSPRPGETIQFRTIWQSNYFFVRVS